MKGTEIREKLADFCKNGDLKKVRMLYAMVEGDMDAANDWDEEFIKELDRREKSFLDGSAKMYTLAEAKQAARARVKAKKKDGLSVQIT